MSYFNRSIDLKLIVAIIFLGVIARIGWMEMHEGASVLNTVSPLITNGLTAAFQFITSIITELQNRTIF